MNSILKRKLGTTKVTQRNASRLQSNLVDESFEA